jgi:enoyl-CoA hydratase/carnithine racemase
MKPYETILTEITGDHLLTVTLNRPEVGNAKTPGWALICSICGPA